MGDLTLLVTSCNASRTVPSYQHLTPRTEPSYQRTEPSYQHLTPVGRTPQTCSIWPIRTRVWGMIEMRVSLLFNLANLYIFIILYALYPCQTNAIPVRDLQVSSHTVKCIEYPNGRMKRLDAHMRKFEVANHGKPRGQHRSTTIDLTNRTILQQPWHSWHQAHLHPNHSDSTE